MNNIPIIYWSGTGHTESMASAIAKGITNAGGQANMVNVSQATLDMVKNSDIIAFGCPAMGAEELEDSEMRPFMDKANPLLSGKKVALFGSYEWAEGEWMQNWVDEINETGCTLIDSIIAYDDPDAEALQKCSDLGQKLAQL